MLEFQWNTVSREQSGEQMYTAQSHQCSSLLCFNFTLTPPTTPSLPLHPPSLTQFFVSFTHMWLLVRFRVKVHTKSILNSRCLFMLKCQNCQKLCLGICGYFKVRLFQDYAVNRFVFASNIYMFFLQDLVRSSCSYYRRIQFIKRKLCLNFNYV